MSTQQSSVHPLLADIKPGDTIYTVLRHVSRSGMTRVIDLIRIVDGRPISIVGPAAQLLALGLDRDRWGVRMSGCGMDMGFAAVYELSYALFKGGFTCTGEGCPANDHANGDRDYTPHAHSDAGYALRQRWM